MGEREDRRQRLRPRRAVVADAAETAALTHDRDQRAAVSRPSPKRNRITTASRAHRESGDTRKHHSEPAKTGHFRLTLQRQKAAHHPDRVKARVGRQMTRMAPRLRHRAQRPIQSKIASKEVGCPGSGAFRRRTRTTVLLRCETCAATTASSCSRRSRSAAAVSFAASSAARRAARSSCRARPDRVEPES